MIHGASKDPVLVKKISLRIWTLRDEVEAVVAKRLSQLDPNEVPSDKDSKDLEKKAQGLKEALELAKLKEEYVVGSDGEPELKLVEDCADEEVEAAAEVEEVAEGEEQAEEVEAAAEAGGEEESEEIEASAESEEKAPEAVKGKKSGNNVLVFQRKPNIPEEKVIHGRSLLSEIGMDKMYFFCDQPFLEGQAIVIEYLIPKHFSVNAEVIYCWPYSMKSRIISKNKLPYRCAVRFTFLKEGERTLLRNLCESIEPKLPTISAPEPKKASGGDEDFDELDDLDL